MIESFNNYYVFFKKMVVIRMDIFLIVGWVFVGDCFYRKWIIVRFYRFVWEIEVDFLGYFYFWFGSILK